MPAQRKGLQTLRSFIVAGERQQQATQIKERLDSQPKDSAMNTKKETAKIKSHIPAAALAAVVASMFILLIFPMQVQAGNNPKRSLPGLEEFVAQIRNGNANTLRGVYIPGVLALPVTQQPGENSNYISPMSKMLTQFSMADKTGNVGLLAHNYLAGGLFFEIKLDDLIILVYGNARMETYTVKQILQYEAEPNGMYKNILSNDIVNTGELFTKMYSGEHHITLQTCIAKGDNPNWGRLFIIARKAGGKYAHTLGAVAAPPPPPSTAIPATFLGWPVNLKAANNAAATPLPFR
jgi:hypothetical protein